jgi:7-keto-8-aminopelargonate synthetase-like enzyme
VGVLGPHGRGLAAEANLSDDVDVQMGTMSKALGASGGYICGSHDLIEWLINRARSFIYSTAPPPAIAAASLAAVKFLSSSEGEARRLLLWERIRLMRELLLSLDVGRSTLGVGRLDAGSKRSTLNAQRPTLNAATSAIFPLLVGDEQAALDLAAALKTEGFLVPAIRYPTVAKGSARLRITVTAAHKENHILSLCEAIRNMTKSK